VPSNFKTFELSKSYRANMKNRRFYIGPLSVTLTVRVVTWLLLFASGMIMVTISAKLF
jgi:hypothetical protein